MSDIAISVENLSKCYRIGLKEQMHETFGGALGAWLKSPFENLKRLKNLTRFTPGESESDDLVWALKDVSFTVKQGEVVGIIGRNGAGKSTLLKILSRIVEPTSGRALINGRVASLLEVGTGFHPELTGRENIYLNGAVLGMTKREIDSKFDDIVSFAEIGKFLDTPVKRYSSGMAVRLAFAVAAHLDPEILLIDEVLAVGDAGFQKKCLGKMGEVAKGGRTVLFVSHNMGAVNRLCDRVIWIQMGSIVADGQSDQIISGYLDNTSSIEGIRQWEDGIANKGVNDIKVFRITVLNSEGKIAANLEAHKSFSVEIKYKIFQTLQNCRVGIIMTTGDGIILFASYNTDNEKMISKWDPGDYTINCNIPAYLLNTGTYTISINAGIPGVRNLVYLENVLTVKIEEIGAVGSHLHSIRKGVIRPMLEWETKRG